jgi:hypothetical protein
MSAWVKLRRTVKPVVEAAEKLQILYNGPVRSLYAGGRLDRSRYRLPAFLGIGAAKAGTTWLHHNLAAHPGLFLPKVKEVHYFCHRYHRSLAWYARHFQEAGERVAGEITPNYGSLPESRIEVVSRLMPEAKLLMMIRNPVDRAWSHAQMRLLRQDRRDPASLSDRDWIRHFRSDSSMSSGDYLGIIDRWLAHYPEDRLWLVTFDEMQSDPKGLLISAFRHLGVSTEVDWDRLPWGVVIDRGIGREGDLVGRRGSGDAIPARLREYLGEMYAPAIARLRSRFGDRVAAWD